MLADELRALVQRHLNAGDLVVRLVDANDPRGLADVRYDLAYEGHRDVIEAIERGEVRHAYPVVDFDGKTYAGGACLISEDPANPYQVLTPADAIVDSMVGGQFDDLYERLVA